MAATSGIETVNHAHTRAPGQVRAYESVVPSRMSQRSRRHNPWTGTRTPEELGELGLETVRALHCRTMPN
jgi:hypothetical protein